MFKFELMQTNKNSINRFAATKKFPILQSHKSYTNL